MLGIQESLTALWLNYGLLRDGLVLAKSLNKSNTIIEVDAFSLVVILMNASVDISLEPILFDCKTLLDEFPCKRLEHIYWNFVMELEPILEPTARPYWMSFLEPILANYGTSLCCKFVILCIFFFFYLIVYGVGCSGPRPRGLCL